MKRNIVTTALLAAMLVIAGCGGGGSGSQPSQNNQAAEDMARNLHEVLGLIDLSISEDGVMSRVNSTLSSEFNAFNLDSNRFSRAVLTKTTETVPGVKPGWTGGHFKNGDKEARVYWRRETSRDAYSYYGWWLDRSNTLGGYSLVFVSTSTAIAEGTSSENVSGATGSATYTGGAAGQYAIYSKEQHESGDFTADAMLKANFDTDRVSGDITNFMVDGRKKNWSVSIQENTNDPIASRYFLGKAVWEIDGEQPNNADQDASEYIAGFRDMDTDGVPSYAGGIFNVRNGNASMIGTFGATKQ